MMRIKTILVYVPHDEEEGVAAVAGEAVNDVAAAVVAEAAVVVVAAAAVGAPSSINRSLFGTVCVPY
jgi:hypothetical protein